MPMAWAAAKAELVTILGGVSITSPITQTIARVYPDPPAAVQDLPCVIIYPPSLDVQRIAGTRYKVYRSRLLLLVRDEDLDRAAAIVDAYRESLVDAFDSNVRLNGAAQRIDGPAVEPAADFKYGLGDYTGFGAILTVHLQDAVAFSA